MNLQFINIDRYRAKCRLVVFLGMLIQSCTTGQGSDYGAIRATIPADVQLDQNKNIALIYYNPGGCPPCNTIIGNLQQYPEYKSNIGNNSFIVFPSISAMQLADYRRMMKEHGNVDIRYINDKKLYKLLEQKDKERFGGKPKWIGLHTKTKECFCFDLKGMFLPDSIFARFN